VASRVYPHPGASWAGDLALVAPQARYGGAFLLWQPEGSGGRAVGG
jgi:hypothetical protein